MAKIRMERTEYALITAGVKDYEQTLATDKPFWVFFAGNIGIATWLMGVIIAGMGLNFIDAMFVITLGGIIGSALPAATALLGPETRLSQLEAGRLALGNTGKKIPALFNWVNAIGWDVINNVLSAAALVSFMTIINLPIPFWFSLAILVGIQMLIGVYGHHLLQDTSKYTGALLGIFFIIIGMFAMHQTHDVPVNLVSTGSIKDILSALALLVAYNIGFALYAADYTRYLPPKTSSKTICMSVFWACFLSLFVLAFFGYMTASAITEQTPEGVMNALQGMTGHFAPLVLFLIAFNSIPCNALNDNSAAYCLMSAGFKFSRPVSAIFGAVIGYVICLLASSTFVDFFENFLFMFAHGIAPWSAIVLVHWFIIHKTERRTPSGITIGCWIFISVTVASILLFSANSLYTGLLSNAIGGVDIGPYIGFVMAGLLYYATFRLWPNKFKVIRR